MPTIEQLHRLLRADPDDPFVLYALAQAHASAGHHDAAIAHYDRCLAADPAYLYAYYHKARSLLALGRHDDARNAILAGLAAARNAGDDHAHAELEALLDTL